jgi:RHS repeat-associated protein
MAHPIADDHANPIQQRIVLLATDNKKSVLAEVVTGKTNHIAYSAYGQLSSQQEVMTRLGFNGELREVQTGWYLLGNGYRAYNPRLMRFHSPDNLSPFGEGGLNAYMYCSGEPVMNSDPTGHFPSFKAVKRFAGNTLNFFFGGVDVTGPRSKQTLKGLQAQEAITDVMGPMRPENTGELSALANVGAVVAIKGTRPRLPGHYPARGDTSAGIANTWTDSGPDFGTRNGRSGSSSGSSGSGGSSGGSSGSGSGGSSGGSSGSGSDSKSDAKSSETFRIEAVAPGYQLTLQRQYDHPPSYTSVVREKMIALRLAR